MKELLVPTAKGLYCTIGDFFIDPLRPVERALITHAHADHARAGHKHVLATSETLAIMAARYGQHHAQHVQAIPYGEDIIHHGVKVRFLPAGHIWGSAQISVEHKSHRIIAAGDYKRRHDPTCPAFEIYPCDVFITEATFGLPVFRHPDDKDEIHKLFARIEKQPEMTTLIGCYALGKAQRLCLLLRQHGYDKPIWLHGAMTKLMELYAQNGFDFGALRQITKDQKPPAGAIILAPPSALHDRWSQQFEPLLRVMASGWMTVRARAKQRHANLGLIISDHADWDELLLTIRQIQAQEVWITHGREEALLRACALMGQPARPLHLVGYTDEDDEIT